MEKARFPNWVRVLTTVGCPCPSQQTDVCNRLAGKPIGVASECAVYPGLPHAGSAEYPRDELVALL